MFPKTHDRKQVWLQTVAHYRNKPEVDSILIQHFSQKRYQEGVAKYSISETNVEFLQEDCVYAAVNLVKQGLNPLLLNMASWVQPGGGVKNGAGSQEEDLFRRSDYHKFLHTHYYPQKRFQAILSKQVEFCRRGREVGYVAMDNPVRMDCVASPCLKNPQTNNGRFQRQEDIDYVLIKIRQLFQIAYENGNDSLVLSAWGCGAFHCPPEHMGELFGEVVKENMGFFRNITFAVIDPLANTGQRDSPAMSTAHRGDQNFAPFKKGFYDAVFR